MDAAKNAKRGQAIDAATEAARGGASAGRRIGFAPGTAIDAVRNVGRVDHAGRHLTNLIAGAQGSTQFREAVKSHAMRILESPVKSFDHCIGGQKVKGFAGFIGKERVVFFLAKEVRGKIGVGELVTAIEPTKQQIINWGL